MENKLKKNSINTVIYLLLAAMLACVVLVSVFTVSSRRRTDAGTKVPQTTDSSVTAPKDTAIGSKDTAQIYSPIDSAPAAKDTEKPVTDADADILETIPVSAVNDNVPTSVDIRYFVIPTAGSVAKEFEVDIPVYSLTMNDYRAHTGVDITAPVGTDVVSASSGTVCRIWNDQLMGRCITIDHGDNIYTTYMNLAEDSGAKYSVGDSVSMGQSIGAIGESALIEISEEPHLHLEMKVNGNYVDPLEYMGIASPQETVYGD